MTNSDFFLISFFKVSIMLTIISMAISLCNRSLQLKIIAIAVSQIVLLVSCAVLSIGFGMPNLLVAVLGIMWILVIFILCYLIFLLLRSHSVQHNRGVINCGILDTRFFESWQLVRLWA